MRVKEVGPVPPHPHRWHRRRMSLRYGFGSCRRRLLALDGGPPVGPPTSWYEEGGGKLLLCFILLAFALRLVLGVISLLFTHDFSVFHSPDSVTYLLPAQAMLSLGAFSTHGISEIVRTPGYPLFLDMGLKIGRWEIVTITLQILLSCATVFLIFKLAMLLFENVRVALISAFLYALEPLSVLYSVKIMPETLFTFFLMSFVYFLVRFLKKESMRDLCFSALSLATATYVKPISYFLIFLTTFALGIWGIQYIKRRFLRVVLFFAIAFIPVVLWQMRNLKETGYSGFSAVFDKTFYFYHVASLEAQTQKIPFDRAREILGFGGWEKYNKKHPEQLSWTQGQKFKWMRKESFRILKKYFTSYRWIYTQGVLRVLLDPCAVEYLRLLGKYPRRGGLLKQILDQGVIKILKQLLKKKPMLFWSYFLMGIVLIFYFILASLGIFSYRESKFILFLTTALMGYFILISGGPQGLARFRHPVMPLISLWGGYGCLKLVSWMNNELIRKS
ncbi:MAG: glycosyltransferase family 39 protein [Chlamydiae bacterium]|nr:glycosyltransferase family 39 protein [Chlamydiota bacterium]MBI3265818.1 glycosyltransferase family 39 protein [Chlamydiota bacterium]